MKLRMLKTCMGSPDGIHVQAYEKAQVVECPESLARVFLENGWARTLKASPAAKTKNAGSAPENKSTAKKSTRQTRSRRKAGGSDGS